MNFIKCEKLEKSMAELQFSVDAEAFKAAVADVFKKEGRKYSVHGFRKGKAPRALIEKMYGADVFTYDAINELFPEAFEAAVKEAGVEQVGRPEVTVDSADETNGVTLTVKVAVKPEVKVGSYNGLTVEKTVHTVSDEAVEAELKRVQERNARELTREGAAENGDIVDIDFEGFVDGVAFEGGKAEHYSLVLGSGSFIPGFEAQVVGHKAGEEFEIFVTFPNRYHAKDLAGKPVVFKVKLIDVCVRQIPALNSDFAKKVANLDTMDELRAQVKQQLHDGKHAGALNRAKDQILTQLADASEGELPSVLVETTYQQQMEQLQQPLQMQRLSLDRYQSQIHETRESFTAKVRSSAEKTARVHMALLQIAQQENLVPTEEDIDKALAARAERAKKTLEEIKEKSDIPAMRRNEGIRKAADWVIEHSTIEDKAENQ